MGSSRNKYEEAARALLREIESDVRERRENRATHYIAAALQQAAEEAAKEERAACAEVAEDCWHGPGDHGCDHGRQIAAAIRARSEDTGR